MKGRRELTNIPGTIRAIDRGDGICELTKAPDVLCITPNRKRRLPSKVVTALGTAGIIGGVAIALILMAPAFGIVFFALISWILFCGWATGE